MKRMRLTLIGAGMVILAMSGPKACHAQQQPSPLEQALGNKLNVEVGAGLQCSVDLITTRTALEKTRAELDRALAQVKELETK